MITYQLSATSFVTLKVCDVLGREMATLVNEEHRPGSYHVTWDASHSPSGVYFYRIQAGAYADTKRLMVLK